MVERLNESLGVVGREFRLEGIDAIRAISRSKQNLWWGLSGVITTDFQSIEAMLMAFKICSDHSGWGDNPLGAKNREEVDRVYGELSQERERWSFMLETMGSFARQAQELQKKKKIVKKPEQRRRVKKRPGVVFLRC